MYVNCQVLYRMTVMTIGEEMFCYIYPYHVKYILWPFTVKIRHAFLLVRAPKRGDE